MTYNAVHTGPNSHDGGARAGNVSPLYTVFACIEASPR